MSSLIHCVYCSASTRPFATADLAATLQKARQTNERLGLTGILLFSEGTFFQVLEGEAEIVDAMVDRIESDPRHAQMTRIIREPIPRRVFDGWTMGFANVSREDLEKIAGSNDFFGKSRCFADLDAGRAKKLLDAFRSGRWRKLISGNPAPAPEAA